MCLLANPVNLTHTRVRSDRMPPGAAVRCLREQATPGQQHRPGQALAVPAFGRARRAGGPCFRASATRWRSLLSGERDAAALYSRLADAEAGERQRIFRELAEDRVLNGRPVLRSGLRQLVVGALAAGVTYGVGHLIGASVS